MAKTKTKTNTNTEHSVDNNKQSAEELYSQALSSIEQLDYSSALNHVEQLLQTLDPSILPYITETDIKNITTPPSNLLILSALPAINLLGEIHIALGSPLLAQKSFLFATTLDPDGTVSELQGGGAEKFLWLAQLSEVGGWESVRWFEKGVKVLKNQINTLQQTASGTEEDVLKDLMVEDKKAKVADALCSVAEIFMTDLSWEDDAENRCEKLVMEALVYVPDSVAALQTLASVRLSQMRVEDAQSALRRSMELWTDLDPDEDDVPDFATRVSLSRLLMEAELEDEAMVVLERLALEDDTSVEACYLGGWCLHLLAGKDGDKVNGGDGEKEDMDTLHASRKWLLNTIRLYDLQQYEDTNLRQHTDELLQNLEKILGPVEEKIGEDEYEEWLDEDASEDEDMANT